MSDDIFEAFESAGRDDGAAIGSRLRTAGARDGMLVAARAARRRRVGLQSAFATLAVLAVGLGVLWALPRALDQRPLDEDGLRRGEEIRESLPFIEPASFQCGEVPSDVPRQATYMGDLRRWVPEIELDAFARWVDGDGETQVATGLINSDAAAPVGAALGFSFHLLWVGGLQEPPRWAQTVAGALVNGSGRVVAVSDGLAARGTASPAKGGLRPFEAVLSPQTCGVDALAPGEYTLVTIVQVWNLDRETMMAAFVDGGLVGEMSVTVAEGAAAAGEVRLTQEDSEHLEIPVSVADEVAADGVPLVDAQTGYRPAAVWREGMNSGLYPSCPRAWTAASGVEAVRVVPLAVDVTGIEVGLVPGSANSGEATLGFTVPAEAALAWSTSSRDTLLLFDSSGAHVGTLGGVGEVLIGAWDGDGPAEVGFNSFFPTDVCPHQSGLPEEPGVYTPVYVFAAGLIPDGTDAPREFALADTADVWVVLPDVVVGEGGAIRSLPIGEITGSLAAAS